MATSRELAEQAFSLLQDALRDSESRAAELDAELRRTRVPRNQLEQQAQVLAHRIETVEAECEKWKRESARLEEILDNERARSKQLRKKLEIAESGPDKAGKKEVNYWRARAERFDRETGQYRQRIAELRNELRAAQAGDESARTQADDKLRARDAQIAELSALKASLESEIAAREQRLGELAEAGRSTREERDAIQQTLTALEKELAEERECTANLSELANERREQITEISEKLDETLERYEEAKWHLERASRFERLVRKRRALITSLITDLRAKQKANVALKAGLDGLRKFKAKSEEQQQKLLVRVEELSFELKETRERLSEKRRSSDSEERLRKSAEKISGLEDKLNSQAGLIDDLEAELSSLKAARQKPGGQSGDTTGLQAALEARDEAVAQLEQNRLAIEDLELEVDNLRAELRQREESTGSGSYSAESVAEIRRRDAQISDLKRKVKDQEREIARLSETAAGWQKKYEFLSADGTSTHKSVAGDS